LSISRALAEAHGGMLEASSAGRDCGATFTLTIPAATPVRFIAPAPPAANDANAGAPPEPGAVRRILLVEDHRDTAMIMLRLLRSANYQVEWSATVKDALHAAANGHFDLVVSDLGLPDGSGVELMRCLREKHGLKGIALSGYGMEEDVQKSREAGFSEHLIKPVNLEALRAAIVAAGAR
jgi:CheY-like chemotaxis protein